MSVPTTATAAEIGISAGDPLERAFEAASTARATSRPEPPAAPSTSLNPFEVTAAEASPPAHPAAESPAAFFSQLAGSPREHAAGTQAPAAPPTEPDPSALERELHEARTRDAERLRKPRTAQVTSATQNDQGTWGEPAAALETAPQVLSSKPKKKKKGKKGAGSKIANIAES